jgi:hypothetical protein
MRRALLLACLVLAACGGGKSPTAALQDCVGKRLPGGPPDHVTASTTEGVRSVSYFLPGGDEIDLTIFPTTSAAMKGEKAAARIGDAQSRRAANVLYGGGLAVETAILDCLR